MELAGDPERRQAIGARSRARTLSELSLRTMAAAHEQLYDDLLADRESRPHPTVGTAAFTPAPETARLAPPPPDAHPLVTTITPCFNHGRYLPECLAAIRAQTHQPLELIVIDDASTDPDTIRVLDELERSDDVLVVRQPANQGPSAARNAGLARATGRYILPVDADNLLLPDAVERMLAQLREAGEGVGFVYPSQQYFGTRRDYHPAPEFDLSRLLEGNFCDTGSLFDAELFHAGVRFAEDIKLGHEDWDLALQLAARGVRGVPAHGPTVLQRKAGFTRSDAVEYRNELFADGIPERFPELFGARDHYGRYGWHAGPAATIKARWSPGVSIIALAPLAGEEPVGRLRERVARQTCVDFELLVRSDDRAADAARGRGDPAHSRCARGHTGRRAGGRPASGTRAARADHDGHRLGTARGPSAGREARAHRDHPPRARRDRARRRRRRPVATRCDCSPPRRGTISSRTPCYCGARASTTTSGRRSI